MALSILYLQKEEPNSDYKHQFSEVKIGCHVYFAYTCFIMQIDEEIAKDFFSKKKKGLFKIRNKFNDSDNLDIKSFLTHLDILQNLEHPFTEHIESITSVSKRLYFRIY
tara:strand:+ start:147 stop:473 length:327 start_codon:yes stop_codon:yes gene_type:complete